MILLSLKAARVNSQLTLIQAANALGINKDTLSRYERNSTDIPRSLCTKIQELYQIPEYFLYFGDIKEFEPKYPKINPLTGQYDPMVNKFDEAIH